MEITGEGFADHREGAPRSRGQLAAFRRAAGYSQAELAALIDYSRSTIANVETGRQHVPPGFWKRADTALHADGALTESNDQVEAASQREREAAARAAREARETLAGHGRPPQAADAAPRSDDAGGWPEQISEAHSAARMLWSDGQHPSVSPIGTADPVLALRWLVAPPDSSAARADGWRGITPGDLARLRGMRHRLKDIDNAHGGGTALPMALSYVRRELPRLLTCRYDEATGRGLFEITAEFQHDIGWMAYDTEKHALAAYYFAHALRFSHAARNRLLGGRILAAMSHQAIHLGRIRQAIDLARAARCGTQQLVTPRAAAMLAAMEACAHAAAGDTRLCYAALDDAENALTRKPGEPEPDWLDFDEGGYLGHAARAYRDLRQPRKAEQLAGRSVALCLNGHSRTRAQRVAIQATAQLQLGDVDAAANTGETIVVEAWNLHSGHVVGDVAALVRAIEPYRARAADGFLEQARQLLAAHPAPTA